MLVARWYLKNSFHRNRFRYTEFNKLALKSLLSYSSFDILDRLYFAKCFRKYFYKSSISFFRNSCLFTGHARSVFAMFKLSRHMSKRSASFGLLMGMRKSSF